MKLYITVQLIIVNIFFVAISACAQKVNKAIVVDSVGGKHITMAAGDQFAASKWKELWWGKHWREEWMTPVVFPVFDLDTTAGGLTALKRGGGHETKTLRLQGANGREYVLRTVDKSLDVLIPEAFKGSFVNDLVNDQISTAHPFGPIVIASLSERIGILHTNPVIVFVPANARLGEFSDDFAGKLCLFEERPSGDGWNNTALTGFADDIVNSEKLFIKLASGNERSVDQKGFLKVRLLDMLINDWDRHEDQWVWVEQKRQGKTIYEPFARDRDQAFSKTDGISLYFLSRPWALRSIQNMDAHIKDVIGTNLSATAIDRKFTNALTVTDWKNIITTVQQQLTDSVILQSLHKMPADIYKLSGDFLYRRLRERRDDMMKFGMRYYKILNKKVTLTGSDQAEVFTINKLDNNTSAITVRRLNKNQQPGDTLFNRVFDHHTTTEINIYGLKGDDQFVFNGATKNKIFIRIIGGDGNDLYSESMLHKGHGRKSNIYDEPTGKYRASESYNYQSTSDTSKTTYNRKAFKYDWWVPLFTPGYNPDDGVVVGARIIYKKQQWNKMPFGWQQSLGITYAASTGAYSLSYRGLFKHAAGKWDLNTAVDYKAPAYVLNFYGFGNETKINTDTRSFYRVRARSLYVNPGISRAWKNNYLKGGVIFNTVKVEAASNKYVSQVSSLIDSSVFKTKYFTGINFQYTYNNVNDLMFPKKGINYYIATEGLANLKNNNRAVANIKSSFTFYFTPFKRITLAHRSGAAVNFGDYEFYQANTIGSDESLRGYWRTRFTGQNTFYQNTDIRFNLADLKGYVFRGKLGVYGFFDDGRVWIKDDRSDKLHTDYGGGIYFIPYNKLALNICYGISEEVKVFTIRTGFLF